MKTSKYIRKYGMNGQSLSKKLNIAFTTLIRWENKGLDVFKESRQIIRKNPKLQKLWFNMKSRCENPRDLKYRFYGGRGIKLKLEKSDLVFLWKRDRAHKLKQASIDRIDSNGHYELNNCRFIEMDQNRKNRWLDKKRKIVLASN